MKTHEWNPMTQGVGKAIRRFIDTHGAMPKGVTLITDSSGRERHLLYYKCHRCHAIALDRSRWDKKPCHEPSTQDAPTDPSQVALRTRCQD